MQLSRAAVKAFLLAGLGVVPAALAQAPSAAPPATEPAASAPTETAPGASAPTAPAAAPSDGAPAPGEPPPASAEPAPAPTPEPAPVPSTAVPAAPSELPPRAAGTVPPATSTPAKDAAPPLPPFERAHSPLTLEGRLGLVLRPDSSVGFDSETHAGSQLALSLYWDFTRELAAGLEIDRSTLGRGTAISGRDSVSVDYTVSSAMLGFRAYPKRSELLDLFVGLQAGVGIQSVSATGTQNNGVILAASSYECGASDAPALQIGGGIGARLMIAPRWGVTARIDGTGRRLSGDVIDGCAQGIGSATTVTGGLGLGYDFDLDR